MFSFFLINSPSNPRPRVEGICNLQLQEISQEWDGRSREEGSVEAGPLSVQVMTEDCNEKIFFVGDIPAVSQIITGPSEVPKIH